MRGMLTQFVHSTSIYQVLDIALSSLLGGKCELGQALSWRYSQSSGGQMRKLVITIQSATVLSSSLNRGLWDRRMWD